MTLEQAIEIGQALLDGSFVYNIDGLAPHEYKHPQRIEALRLVLAAAKRPYALDRDARNEIAALINELDGCSRARLRALSEALNLAAAPSVLSEGSRRQLQFLLDKATLGEPIMMTPAGDEANAAALTEALSLSPPFTREDYYLCAALCQWGAKEKLLEKIFDEQSPEYLDASEERLNALLAKLDAYLESLPQEVKRGDL